MGQAPTVPVRRVGGLARAIAVLTGIAVIGALAVAALTPGVVDRARDFLAGDISEDEFLDGYSAMLAARSVLGLTTVATAILTIIWMYRIAANLRDLGRRTSWAPLFAVFGWVLPPVLVIIPFLMLRELWKASAPFVTADDEQWRSEPDVPVIWVWFLLYGVLQTVLLVVQTSTLFGGDLSNDAESVAESLDDAVALTVVGALGTAAAGVAWIVLVRQLTARHTALTRER